MVRLAMATRAWWVAAAILAQCVAAETVSLRDILSFQTIDAVAMAPDGSAVAYVSHIPDLASNTNPRTLKAIDADGRSERLLLTANKIEQVAWSADSRKLHGLIERNGASIIVGVDATNGKTTEIWAHDGKIERMSCAEDGRLCAFVATDKVPREVQRRRQEEGMVYIWGQDTVQSILRRSYAQGTDEGFHLVDRQSGTAKRVHTMEYDGMGRQLDFVEEMALSPDGKYLGVGLLRRGGAAQDGRSFNYDVVILELSSGKRIEAAPASVLNERRIAWSQSSDRLFFMQDGDLKSYDIAAGRLEPLAWASTGHTGYFNGLRYDGHEHSAYAWTPYSSYRFDFKKRRVTRQENGFGSDGPSFSRRFDAYAFVDQASERRPEVATRDRATNKVTRLTNLNPWLEGRELGRIEKIQVANASGVSVDAYLLYPVGYVPGKRYPCVIATYGFRGEFVLTAEWHTTFPAQTFAGRGYAVLMLNRPPYPRWTFNDPVKARELLGWQMLSTFDNAFDAMVSRGIADPDRMGIYGWSHGGFIVQFVLAHSSKRYRAAAFGDGGDYNPGEYWAWGTPMWPANFQNTYGGPLSEKTFPAYLEFSPVFKAQRFAAPLLMEFAGRNGFFGMEIYVPLKTLNKPVELVTYDDEEHNFVMPRARLASMGRKLDWFDFWMREREDPDPAKGEQYERWRKMRVH